MYSPVSKYQDVVMQPNDFKDEQFKVVNVYEQQMKMFTHVNTTLNCFVILLSKVNFMDIGGKKIAGSINTSGDIILIIERHEAEARYLVSNLEDLHEFKKLNFMDYFEREITWVNKKMRGFIYYKTALNFKAPEPILNNSYNFSSNNDFTVLFFWDAIKYTLFIKSDVLDSNSSYYTIENILTSIPRYESEVNDSTEVLPAAWSRGAFARYKIAKVGQGGDDGINDYKVSECYKSCFLSEDLDALAWGLMGSIESNWDKINNSKK